MLKPNTNCIQSGRLFYKYKYRKTWLLLYYHDFSKVGKWDKAIDAMNYSDPNKYSIIYYLNDDFKIDDSYEFLLDYPEVEGQNIWRQKNNPLNEHKAENKTKAEGYKGISISWSTQFWGGLFKSAGEGLLEGSYLTGYSWYGIGRIIEYKGAVPGPDKVVNKTQLWVRVRSITNYSCHIIRKQTTHFLFIIFLIYS